MNCRSAATVDYPRHYDAGLLFPIARALGRTALSLLDDGALPFAGHDRWHAYELSLARCARQAASCATATFTVPADSPNLVESKSLKLYLNSFNATRFDSDADVRARIAADLSHAAGAPVDVRFGLPPIGGADDDDVLDLDALDVAHRRLRPAERRATWRAIGEIVANRACARRC